NTNHLGLAMTSNIFQQHPTNFARQMATLDHISKGRIAWNIVTGVQDNGYRVEGPFLPSPSPQRTPLLFQAGSSGAGRAFAARNAEAIFMVAPTPEIARQQIEEIRALAVSHGRRPDDV